MKPQLRLEAIARALRFRTHAAMVAAMKEATPDNPLLLQMSFGTRSEIVVETALRAHVAGPDFRPDEITLDLIAHTLDRRGLPLCALRRARRLARRTRSGGDPTLADAILDRLVHNAHRLELSGESMRKRSARRPALDPEAAA